MQKFRRLLGTPTAPTDHFSQVSASDHLLTLAAESELSSPTEDIMELGDEHGNNNQPAPPLKTSFIKKTASKLTVKLLESNFIKLIRPPECRTTTTDESPTDWNEVAAIDILMQPYAGNENVTEITNTPSADQSRLRLSLEPIRAQIVSYLILLRKMTTDHPVGCQEMRR